MLLAAHYPRSIEFARGFTICLYESMTLDSHQLGVGSTISRAVPFLNQPFCKLLVSFLSTKYKLRHNYNVLTKFNWDFAIVMSIDLNSGHVELLVK